VFAVVLFFVLITELLMVSSAEYMNQLFELPDMDPDMDTEYYEDSSNARFALACIVLYGGAYMLGIFEYLLVFMLLGFMLLVGYATMRCALRYEMDYEWWEVILYGIILYKITFWQSNSLAEVFPQDGTQQ